MDGVPSCSPRLIKMRWIVECLASRYNWIKPNCFDPQSEISFFLNGNSISAYAAFAPTQKDLVHLNPQGEQDNKWGTRISRISLKLD